MKNWQRLLIHLCLLLLLSAQKSNGQSRHSYLTLFNHVPLFDAPVLLGVEESADNQFISLSTLALAYHWETINELYHEIELSRLGRNRFDNGSGFTTTETASIGYEIGAIFPRKYNNIVVRMGGSARYYYGFRTIDDLFTPIEQTTHGLIISSNLHVDWRLYKNWYFGMAPSIQLLNGSFLLEQVYDPQFQLTEDETAAVDFFFKPFQLLLRFGVSYRIE